MLHSAVNGRGKTLRRIRKTLGMNQQQLADALGVTRSTISDCERGAATTPTERLLAALALAMWQVAQRPRRPFL